MICVADGTIVPLGEAVPVEPLAEAAPLEEGLVVAPLDVELLEGELPEVELPEAAEQAGTATGGAAACVHDPVTAFPYWDTYQTYHAQLEVC